MNSGVGQAEAAGGTAAKRTPPLDLLPPLQKDVSALAARH